MFVRLFRHLCLGRGGIRHVVRHVLFPQWYMLLIRGPGISEHIPTYKNLVILPCLPGYKFLNFSVPNHEMSIEWTLPLDVGAFRS